MIKRRRIRNKAVVRLPALQGARVDAGDAASGAQPRAGVLRHLDVLGEALAISEVDHSSFALLKIAAYSDAGAVRAVSRALL